MARPFRIGIAPLLSLSTAAAALVFTFTLIEIIGTQAAGQLEADIGQNLAEVAFQTTDQLDRGMYERYREVQLMAERYEITDKGVPAQAKRKILESMQETYPYYAWIGLTDDHGKVLVATKGMLEGADVSQRPWYAAAYRGDHLRDVHEAVLLAKLLPAPTNEPKRFFDIAFPYRGKGGVIEGVLGTHLSWQWARDVEDSVLRPLARRKGVETLILSRSGRVLLGPGQLRDADLDLASFTASRRAKNGFVVERWPDGKRYLVGYSRSEGYRSYPGLGWTVLVRQDVDAAYLPVTRLKTKIFWGGLAAAVLVSALLWALARSVTGALRTIARHAEALRLGEVQHIPPVGSRLREVHVLERALNALLGDLRTKEDGLREVNASLETRVRERTDDLHQAAEETRNSERRVRAIIDTALDAFVGVDAAGRITDWNPRAEAIFGWSRAEALGRQVAQTIVPPRHRQAQGQGVADPFTCAGSAAGQRLQWVAMRRDGEEFPAEMTIGLINAGDEHFVGAFVQDISERKRIEDDLAREREVLDAVLDSIDVGVVVCGRNGQISLFNRAACELQGLPATPVPPAQWAEHYDLYAADGVTRFAPEQIPLYRALQGEVVKNVEMTVRPRGRAPRFLFGSGRALHARDGTKIGAVIAMKDVTGLKESERRLEASERLLRTIADNLPVLIAYIDRDERYQFANATYEAWFGVPPSNMLGRTVRDALGDALYEQGRDFLQQSLAGHPSRYETEVAGLYGVRRVDIAGIPDVRDGVVHGMVVLASDVTAARRHEQELDRLARVDILTGLPNRRCYEERLAEALQRAARSGRGLALMFLDLDHFKQINDTLGHAGGDVVLQEFGRRLKASVRATDIVSRLAGDEFTIVLEGLNDAQEAALVAGKVIEAMREKVAIQDRTWQVSASIGVAYVHGQMADAAALSQQADAALYRAKAEGRGRYALA
jgi:diguanylate cyclase (GGDEF)-like protein/PAS domain S-box-containing protein